MKIPVLLLIIFFIFAFFVYKLNYKNNFLTDCNLISTKYHIEVCIDERLGASTMYAIKKQGIIFQEYIVNYSLSPTEEYLFITVLTDNNRQSAFKKDLINPSGNSKMITLNNDYVVDLNHNSLEVPLEESYINIKDLNKHEINIEMINDWNSQGDKRVFSEQVSANIVECSLQGCRLIANDAYNAGINPMASFYYQNSIYYWKKSQTSYNDPWGKPVLTKLNN